MEEVACHKLAEADTSRFVTAYLFLNRSMKWPYFSGVTVLLIWMMLKFH